MVDTVVKTGEIDGGTRSGKERGIMGGKPEGREQEIMGGGLRNGRTLEGRRMDIMLVLKPRCINRVTIININIAKMTEEGTKEATAMRTVEDGSGKMIGEGAMAKEQRWLQMLPQAIFAFESLLSWRGGWLSVWSVLTG